MFSNPYPFDSVTLTQLLFFLNILTIPQLIGVMSEIMYSNEQCACADCIDGKKKNNVSRNSKSTST